MRKLISVALVVLMVLAFTTASFSALNSPSTDGKYSVAVSSEGEGSASSDKGSVDVSSENGQVTLSASEAGGFFTKWIITGTYRIVSGDLYSPVLVIEPTSDIEAVASFSEEEDYLTINVDKKGEGNVTATPNKIAKGSGETVTLTAEETGKAFVKWILACEYDIVEGSLTTKTLVIRPYTDINATAVFETDEPAPVPSGDDSGSTSPKTGDYSVLMIALVLMAMGLGAFAVKKIKE